MEELLQLYTESNNILWQRNETKYFKFWVFLLFSQHLSES